MNKPGLTIGRVSVRLRGVAARTGRAAIAELGPDLVRALAGPPAAPAPLAPGAPGADVRRAIVDRIAAAVHGARK